MSGRKLYCEVRRMLSTGLGPEVDESSRERLTLLVLGILKARSAAPARIAQALYVLRLSTAQVARIERRIRRIENDPEIRAKLCVHPFARWRLRYGRPQALTLILDSTLQEDRLVLLTVSVWYRGRALPLVWDVWPANQSLTGAGFWERVAALLAQAAALLPAGVAVTWLADRAFGTPGFTDLVEAHGWSYVVRTQGHTRCRDRLGREHPLCALVRLPGQRAKLRGQVFKKRGWRPAAVLVYWGRRAREPLCLVSNLGAHWRLVHLYRQRYAIEASFRDFKSHGWRWEQGQVTDLAHVHRLLVGMALALWIALAVGTQVAREVLQQPVSGQRRTLPWEGKRSLFSLGLLRLDAWFHDHCDQPLGWHFSDWQAPNWQTQLYHHLARAFVFADHA